MNILIRKLNQSDNTVIAQASIHESWPKPLSLFENYFHEQEKSERAVWVALVDDQYAGYVTLHWHSLYQPFALNNIPEIVDLNVFPSFRNKGIGSQLLAAAEQEASLKSESVGLGVGLYGGPDGGYGPAQQFYIKRGYIPDGNGITSKGTPLSYGESFILNDDLILWFTKNLSS